MGENLITNEQKRGKTWRTGKGPVCITRHGYMGHGLNLKVREEALQRCKNRLLSVTGYVADGGRRNFLQSGEQDIPGHISEITRWHIHETNTHQFFIKIKN